jgi:hypothetical protein
VSDHTVADIRAIRNELVRFYMDPDGLNRRARGIPEPIVYHDRGIEEWDAVALAHGVEEAKRQIRTFPEYKEQHPDEQPPASGPLQLGISGQFFTLNGQPWTAIESSEFSLYKRYLDGEDLRPVLAERQAIGFTLLRVWMLNTSVIPGGLRPAQYPQFYASLAPFAALCASYGCCVEFTAFTQTKTLMPTLGEQRAHWENVQVALRGVPNVLLELVNEADQHDNATDPALLTMRPSGSLASSGSNGAGSLAPTPVWDYGLYHSNGLSEWQRKCAHNAFEKVAELHHIPAMANENTRYPDQDSSVVHAEDAAAGAALLSAGACFHSAAGKLSVPFSAVEFQAATAWVRGAESVPLEFQHGQYHRRDDLLEPGLIRVYERRLPDGRGWIVRIRA